MDIGQDIKAARKRVGITQKQLAEKIGVAAITIQQYENGAREPKMETIAKIANALGVSVYSLLNFDQASALLENQINEEISDFGSEWPEFSRIRESFLQLNHKGAEKAATAVEDLAKVPEYRK